MKCIEVEKNINLLLDEEIGGREQERTEAHLADCRECREEFKALRKTRGLLAAQQAILPPDSFDNRMLQMFEGKLKKTPEAENSRFARLFVFPRLLFAATLVIFAIGLGIAFQVGRWSMSSQPHLTAGQEAENRILPAPSPILEPQTPKQDVPQHESAYSDKTMTKTIIKYVKVPVIRTRLVERLVDAENPGNNPAVAPRKNDPDQTVNRSANFAGRMNLKDLQPITNVTYKIIKKGENNEE